MAHPTQDREPENGENPFRVLGIAMVVDQRGIGARLVARYPTKPVVDDTNKEIAEDIFFKLTSRQMAKLFRMKKTLCGQPVTLNVDGTVFCCRAVLIKSDEASDESGPTSTTSTATSAASDKGNLVLFSIIIALSTTVQVSSLSLPGIFVASNDEQNDLERFLSSAPTTDGGDSVSSKHPTPNRASSSYLSIRRVHLSLARICRVLEREEFRCQYVSMQVHQFFDLRNDQQNPREQEGNPSSPSMKSDPASQVGSGSMIAGKSSKMKGRHSRNNSFATTLHTDREERLPKAEQIGPSVEDEQEKEQEILELMLAAQPPKSDDVEHHGNMMRELVQVFHSLSRNDHSFPPTPTAILSERDGVVYVNRHIAVPIEAVSVGSIQTTCNPTVRPYSTLLFPHASPAELLLAFNSSGSAAPQRLQQLLLTVNPQKPLSDIAVDANLPLHSTLDIASYLVAHGACVTSTVVSRSSRTLGKAMSNLINVESESGAWLRQCLLPLTAVINSPTRDMTVDDVLGSVDHSPGNTQGQQQQQRWMEELEELLFAMTIWLLSHHVLTQMQDYLVAIEDTSEMPILLRPAASANSKASTTSTRTTKLSETDETILQELLELNVLDGTISIPALCWRCSLDPQQIRSWALRNRRIRLVSRIASPTDDWNLSRHSVLN